MRIFQKAIAFDLTVRPERPDDWTGVVRFPIYEMPLKKGQASKRLVFAPKGKRLALKTKKAKRPKGLSARPLVRGTDVYALLPADLDGDGRKEAVTSFSASYPVLKVLDAEGRLVYPGRRGHPGLTIDSSLDVAALDGLIVSLERRRVGFCLPERRLAEVRGNFSSMATGRLPNGEPLVTALTATCDLFKVRLRCRGAKVEADAQWLGNIGEKGISLLLLDLGGDRTPEILVGTKFGALLVFSLDSGAELDRIWLSEGPIRALLRLDNSIFAAGREGVWVVKPSPRLRGRLNLSPQGTSLGRGGDLARASQP